MGIGRATLYKYFPDVGAIMVAWHERQVGGHLRQLAEATAGATAPAERLHLALRTYAELSAGHHHAAGPTHAPDLTGPLHRAAHMNQARERLHGMLTELIGAAVENGDVRDDVPATELAAYCLHALAAARDLPSHAGRNRLVTVTLAGLRPEAGT
ncbi:hypothetical protein GCM10009682_28900 [Luedemannella flava]|uniref:Transcriptional regulator SbtR-like C-terminal domain-containing protein n=1 Tax=Luedemannella flava TaxID=349316 RepID=A0ABP4YB09_9ACTN